MTVVADTGPLIALAKIEKVYLLHDLYQQVVTGPTVYTEAVTAGLAMNAADAVC
jgi:predicted nucleic acid-binding protein